MKNTGAQTEHCILNDIDDVFQMAFFGKTLIDKGKEGAFLHTALDDTSLDEDMLDPHNDPFAFPDSPVKSTPPVHPASTNLMQSSLADQAHQMASQSDDDADKIQSLGSFYSVNVSLCL